MNRKDLSILRKDGWSSASRFLLPSILLSPRLTNFDVLKKMGFINLFLYDETEGKQKFYKDSVGLLFNPSYSFFENDWNEFIEMMQSYKNLIEIVDYGDLVFLLWFRISHPFLPNLRYNFKLGKFSQFPKNYLAYLNDTERRVCLMDDNYRIGLEKSLGLEEGDLEGVELASVPDKESYVFDFNKY